MLPIVDLETGEVVTDTGRSLAELESVIEHGIDTVREVGQALSEIRYRWRIFKRETGYSDFDAYCRERWGFSRRRADQMIEAAEVVEVDDNSGKNLPVLSSNNIAPKNDAQLRELARVDPARRTEVWEAAVETFGEKVTAENVRQVAETLPANVVEAAYEITDEAGKDELDRLRFRAALFRSLKRAVDLLAYQPEHVAAALARDEKRTEVDGAIRMLAEWSKEIDEFQGERLRVVRGGTA
jgi:hypothetical protein